MSTLRMNPGWEKQIMRAAEDGIKRMGANLERSLNALLPQYTGKPIAEVKVAVKNAWTRSNDGAKIDDPELTAFAEAIQSGTHIRIEYKGIK